MGILHELKTGPQNVHPRDHQKGGQKTRHFGGGGKGPILTSIRPFDVKMAKFTAHREGPRPKRSKSAKMADFGTKSAKTGDLALQAWFLLGLDPV